MSTPSNSNPGPSVPVVPGPQQGWTDWNAAEMPQDADWENRISSAGPFLGGPYRYQAYTPLPGRSAVENRLAVQHGWTNTPPVSETAIWALVAGVVGILAGWCLLGAPCIAAVVAGHVAIKEIKSGGKSGNGLAVTGLVLGYVGLIPAVILFFWLVLGTVGTAAGV